MVGSHRPQCSLHGWIGGVWHIVGAWVLKIHSQKSGVKSEELVVEKSLKLDALNLDWLGVINGPTLHGKFRKECL